MSEVGRRASVLVSVGQSVTAGQDIGNLRSQDSSRHVHFGVWEGEGGGNFGAVRCLVEYFSADAALHFEALYDSGLENRPGSRPNLCD